MSLEIDGWGVAQVDLGPLFQGRFPTRRTGGILEAPRVTAQPRGFRHREQWVFQPRIDPEGQARALR